MTVETVQATDFVLVVDNLDGLHAYRVTHFEVDVNRAVLRPVCLVDGNVRSSRYFSSFATLRLVNPETQPEWLYTSALRLLDSNA